MGGGLFLLTVSGTEDLLLTGEPTVTFFKSVYRQHVNFSKEPVKILYDGRIQDNSSITFTIPKNADLLSQCYLQIENLPNGADIYQYFSLIEFMIGGNVIDSMSSYQLYLENEINHNDSSYKIYEKMKETDGSVDGGILPLQFFFCKSYSKSLPMTSISDQEVQIILHLQNTTLNIVKDLLYVLWCDYIYLDKKEVERFIVNEHNILIEQHQRQDYEKVTSRNHRSKLVHKFLVKEIQWLFVEVSNTDDSSNPVSVIPEQGDTSHITSRKMFDTSKIICNGIDLFMERNQKFYTLLSHYKYHKRLPIKNIFSYSFSLYPQEEMPCGFINLSKIDIFIQFFDVMFDSTKDLYLYHFCSSWNFLKIKDGMCFLGFV